MITIILLTKTNMLTTPSLKMAVMNQWTVPLDWNSGMEYWNSLNCNKMLLESK